MKLEKGWIADMAANPTLSSEHIAARIVERLFVNGQGQKAQRLVLTSAEGRDLGGWCKHCVIDQIVKAMREEDNGR